MERGCCRRFNVPQANHHIIGQRVGTTRRNIGLYQKKTAAEFAQAFALSAGKLRDTKLKAATHRAAYLDETPHAHNSMSSICVGDGDSWRLHRS